MVLPENKVYTYLSLACVAGYGWVFTAKTLSSGETGLNLCFIKQVTHLPCPSCGATRSILSFLNGNFSDALLLNPIGLLLFAIMTILPLWLAYDFIFHTKSLLNVYIKTEHVLKRKRVAIPLVMMIIVNWAWNIYKQL